MYQNGHIGVGLLLYSPLAFVAGAFAGLEAAVLGGVAVAGLATVPDVDMRVPFITHRGPTHTAWFGGMIAVLAGLTSGVLGFQRGILAAVGLLLFGTLVGAIAIGSHIVADALTPMGIRPFEPWRSTRYTWNLFTAANPIANNGLLGLGLLASGAAAYAGLWVHSLF